MKQPLNVSFGSVMSSQSKGEVHLTRAQEENMSIRQQSDQMLVVKKSIAVQRSDSLEGDLKTVQSMTS